MHLMFNDFYLNEYMHECMKKEYELILALKYFSLKTFFS
jgi:hypothetical protein